MVLAPSQIKPHQDTYEAVVALFGERFHCAEDMSFPTIWAEFNGPLSHSQCYIAGANINYVPRYGAVGHPKSSFIRTFTRL